ncbi:MAG: FtsK [Armatimonadetes bacterium CSP1-3]|nr:MAG: FtsK [Armatimonadetes bacterium CSP1-3]
MAKRRKRTPSRRAGTGLLLLVAALIFGLSFLPRATGIALLLGRWQRLVLGQAAIAIPIVLFLGGLVLIVARGRARFTPRVQGLLLAGLAAAAAGHAWVPADREFAVMRAGEGTGALGAVLVWAGRALVGDVGLWLLIILASGVAAFRFFHVPLAKVVEALLTLGRGLIWTLGQAGRLARRLVVTLARTAAAGAASAGRTAYAALADGLHQARTAAAQWLEARRAGARSAETLVPGAAGAGPAAVGSGGGTTPPAAGPSVLPLVPAGVTAAPGAPATPSADESQTPPAARRRAKERVIQESLLPEAQQQYELPPITLLGELSKNARGLRSDPTETARALEQTLTSFGVEAKVVHWEQGPVVTRFEVQPAPGVKVQRIASLTNDIALHLAASSVRIEAPIPGKSAVGIEIPNTKSSLVHIKEILSAPAFQSMKGSLVMALGKDLTGHPIVADLTEMPHLLIAGTTGSGKSVALNAIIASFLFRYTPHQVRFVMIDPKRIEMTNYNDIPHLLVPVVINPRATAGALREMLRVMEERFTRFAEVGVRNIQAFNELTDVTPLPFIVIVIDELADLMMVAPADFEDVICRLAQMTRATGIHLVVATQRPSVDVITGLIKANIPSRIAFAVSSQVDSRTIIDGPGAEKLLGRGDMLFLPMGASRPVRAQGSFIADGEIQALVDWWRGQGKPVFDQTLVAAGRKTAAGEGGRDDERLADAARVIVRAGYGSVSLLQRKMRIGYVTAARLVDQLEERGIVGPAQGSNPREVMVGLEGLERLLRQQPDPPGTSTP